MARNKQLIRILNLMKFYDRRKKINLKSASKKLKVHVKTIRRDLKALRAVGIKYKIKTKNVK